MKTLLRNIYWAILILISLLQLKLVHADHADHLPAKFFPLPNNSVE